MSERAFAPIYEISSENKIAGRRPIKVVLHEIFPDNTRWQENGISWKEEYVQANLHSVVGMSIVAEFLTEDRDVPYNHGMTDVREEDKLPLFEDATMVGHFDKAYVDDVEIGGVTKRCLVAEGTLDEMRYPKFVAWLRENMADSVVKGSVEIVGKPEHDGYIIYSGGWKEEGRVPQYYDYSGYAILSVKPADEAAIVMELNNKKLDKEDGTMDEKTKNELMAAVTGAVSEVNSKWEEYWAKVDTLLAEIMYGFNQEQKDYLAELLQDENNQLWSQVLYGIGYSDDQIVTVALSQVGNVGGQPYWSWYGFDSRVEWCACFVSWCANECGYIDAGIIPKYAGCVNGVQWFRDRGQWADGSYEPSPGTIIFFDWEGDGVTDHTGIVQRCENGTVYTVEGNSGDTCRTKTYPVGSSVIYGYGIPAY